MKTITITKSAMYYLRCMNISKINHSLHCRKKTKVFSTSSHTTSESRFEELAKNARLTDIAHELMLLVIKTGDTAVDATCGNGNDTVFLAQEVGATGKLYAFDIQESAIHATQAALEKSIPSETDRPTLILQRRCHSEIQKIVGSNVARVICFNLGYLPGGDKSVTTRIETTVAAIESSLEVVSSGGLISILCYIGHPGGNEEYEAVKKLVGALPAAYWLSSEIRLLNRPSAPINILIWKRNINK